ncbi:MAG: hypothetical protein HYR85_04735 [Planctomycetes bacterium]|nr:hypothetical protein [Planctomycetota bacterium]MBI3844153.1 hypothetical protein [Planctomycetota bacterium]
MWSVGRFPNGVSPRALSRTHISVLRNPLIAEVFHRSGLIEKWGRGTNRVIEMCRAHGIAPPEFEEVGPAVLVTFRVPVGMTARVTDQVGDQVTPHVTEHVTAHVTAQVTAHVRRLLEAASEPMSREALQMLLRLKHRQHFLRAYLWPLLKAGWLEMTLPEKPRSREQRYRTTEAGRRALEESRP